MERAMEKEIVHDSTSDLELILLSKKNPDNFKFIVRRYQKPLLDYIRNFGGTSRKDCEDVLQEAFLKVYKNLNTFDPTGSFSGWLFFIVRNQAISNFRKNKRYLHMDQTLFESLQEKSVISGFFNSDNEHETVINTWKKLSVNYREVFYLKYYHGLDYSDISEILHIPIGTVGIRLNRAKTQFKKEYKNTLKREGKRVPEWI